MFGKVSTLPSSTNLRVIAHSTNTNKMDGGSLNVIVSMP